MQTTKVSRRQFLRSSAIVGLGAASAGLLAACGGAPAAPTAAPTSAPPKPAATTAPAATAAAKAPAASNVELRLQAPAAPLGNMAIEFAKRFTADKGVKVTTEETVYGEIESKTQTGFISGTLQDIVYGHHRWLFINFLKGIYLQIDELLKSSPPTDYADIFPSIMAGNSLDNKNFSLPDVTHPGGNIVITYNKNILKEKGLAEPKAGWTMDDWAKLARAAADPKKGVFGMALDGMDSLHYYSNMSRSWGDPASKDGWLLDEDGKKVTYNTPTHKEIADWYTSLIADKAAPRPSDSNNRQELFDSGLAATHAGIVGSLATSLAATTGKFDIDATILPVGPKGRQGTCYSGNQWMVNSKTKAVPEAWELAKYLTSTEAGVGLVQLSKNQPNGRKSAWTDPRVQSLNKMFGVAGLLLAKGVEKFPMPSNTRFTETNNKFLNLVNEIWEGTKKWDAAAPVIEKEVQAVLDLPRP